MNQRGIAGVIPCRRFVVRELTVSTWPHDLLANFHRPLSDEVEASIRYHVAWRKDLRYLIIYDASSGDEPTSQGLTSQPGDLRIDRGAVLTMPKVIAMTKASPLGRSRTRAKQENSMSERLMCEPAFARRVGESLA